MEHLIYTYMGNIRPKTEVELKADVRDLNAVLGSRFNLKGLQAGLEKKPHLYQDVVTTALRWVRSQQRAVLREELDKLRSDESPNSAGLMELLQKVRKRKDFVLRPLFESEETDYDVFEERLYQEYIREKFRVSDGSMGVDLPTGVGKTLIAFGAALDVLNNPGKKGVVVMTAPSNALCEQHRKSAPSSITVVPSTRSSFSSLILLITKALLC